MYIIINFIIKYLYIVIDNIQYLPIILLDNRQFKCRQQTEFFNFIIAQHIAIPSGLLKNQ